MRAVHTYAAFAMQHMYIGHGRMQTCPWDWIPRSTAGSRRSSRPCTWASRGLRRTFLEECPGDARPGGPPPLAELWSRLGLVALATDVDEDVSVCPSKGIFPRYERSLIFPDLCAPVACGSPPARQVKERLTRSLTEAELRERATEFFDSGLYADAADMFKRLRELWVCAAAT
jgi:hypothetical protein